MKNLKKISRSELNKIVGAERGGALCTYLVEHDGAPGRVCGCDAHCASFKCGLTGKCL